MQKRKRERSEREEKFGLHGVMQGPTRTRQGEAATHLDSAGVRYHRRLLCAVDYTEASLA